MDPAMFKNFQNIIERCYNVAGRGTSGTEKLTKNGYDLNRQTTCPMEEPTPTPTPEHASEEKNGWEDKIIGVIGGLAALSFGILFVYCCFGQLKEAAKCFWDHLKGR
ncbi:uncharacterized protein LOC134815566 [Bolinopsis microptera]|uniref:uncharacterized protein LOC134815566 n=1 Tax=Bolinopsis microptera TaxID=2820187 RepID=UPI003078E2E7